jgi:3-deoxy-D-manno-octulosonic-acid transferase
MILFLYNVGLLLALVVGAPWWLWQMATTRKYREGLRERLGAVPGRLLDAATGVPVIWLHAVSVGEVLAISRLVAELEASLAGCRLVISTATRTGQALARERFGASRVFYCPLDLPWAVHAYLQTLKPSMLILAETEFWPNLLSGSFRRNIPVVVVNARISDRSWPRYWRLRGLWKPFLSPLTAVLAQNQTDAERLQAIGCTSARVTVTGNLKFDVRATETALATQLLKALAGSLRLIVAGSTLEGEEEMLLAAWMWLLAETGDSITEAGLALVLAPRHPERFATVAALLERSGFHWRRRSEITPESPALVQGEVVLLDSIGELASVYSLAAVAFVGGSLIPAGGHNPLEPAQFGVPVVMGEHFANFRGIVEMLRAADALTIAGKSELAAVIASLLRDRKVAKDMGNRAREVFEAQAGATGRTVAAISEILSTREQA